MSSGLRFVFVVVAPLVVSGTSFADPASPPASETEEASADPAAPAAEAQEAPASRYPRDVISRPLTYPKGLGTVGLDVSSLTSSFADPATVRLLAGYGITDDIELNFGHYMFPTNDAGKGTLDFGAGMKLLRGAMGGKLEVIGRVQSGYSLAAEDLNPLLVGVHAQYNITPKIAVLTPGGQLSVALAGDPKPVTFGLPVSLAWQATPIVYLQLDTQLATLEIANAANAFIFADSTPVAFTAYVNAVPQVDVFAGFSANLTPADTTDTAGNVVETELGDTLGVIVGARYYFGKL